MSWQCRTDALDGDLGLRWGHLVSATPGEVSFLGFASDEGVRRNQGRVGAAGGPGALRRAMANLAVRKVRSFGDLGDVSVTPTDLESAQKAFAIQACSAIREGCFVVGLGGGHEIAYASYLGLRQAKPESRIGILYFDAHLDLREGPKRTSGTPFLDALGSDKNAVAFAVGINPSANTHKLSQTATKYGVGIWLDHEVASKDPGELARWIEGVDDLYVSFDLDVLPAHEAPGVSAPAGFGVSYSFLRPVLEAIAKTGKLRIFDVAELNPEFDIDMRTARLGARIIWDVVEWRT